MILMDQEIWEKLLGKMQQEDERNTDAMRRGHFLNRPQDYAHISGICRGIQFVFDEADKMMNPEKYLEPEEDDAE